MGDGRLNAAQSSVVGGGDEMKRIFGDGSEGDVVTAGGNQYLGHTKGFNNLEVAAATVYRPLTSIITCKQKFTLKGEIRLKGRNGGTTMPGFGGLSGSKSPDAPPPIAISLANRGSLPWPTMEEDGVNAMTDGSITGKTGVQYGTYNAVPSGDPVPAPCSYPDGTLKFRGNGGIGGSIGPVKVTCGDPQFFGTRSAYFKADAVGGVEIALMLNKIFEHAPNFFDLDISGGLGGGSGDYSGVGAEIPGAGGGAGGMVVIIADEIVLEAGSKIDVGGGAGENARDPMVTGNPAGGGGGGGGGAILFICNTFTDNGCTFNFAGGAGGNGINGGGAGMAGTDGWKKLVELPQ